MVEIPTKIKETISKYIRALNENNRIIGDVAAFVTLLDPSTICRPVPVLPWGATGQAESRSGGSFATLRQAGFTGF